MGIARCAPPPVTVRGSETPQRIDVIADDVKPPTSGMADAHRTGASPGPLEARQPAGSLRCRAHAESDAFRARLNRAANQLFLILISIDINSSKTLARKEMVSAVGIEPTTY